MPDVDWAVRVRQCRRNCISFWVLHKNQIGRKSTILVVNFFSHELMNLAAFEICFWALLLARAFRFNLSRPRRFSKPARSLKGFASPVRALPSGPLHSLTQALVSEISC
jgi:hypothetical protein